MNPRVSEVAIIEAHQKVYKGTYRVKNMGHESKKCWICLYLRSDGVLGYDIILNFTWLEFGMDTLVIITINMKHFGVVKDDGTYISNVKFTQKKI